MKLIEAMKLIKELQVKAEDIRKKIRDHSADLDYENPMYPDQKRQVQEWLQSHSDILKEVLKLRVAIQRTNIVTPVTVHLNGDAVTKTIAEWIHRRRDLATNELTAWSMLTDRNLKEGVVASTIPGGAPMKVQVRRYYDPVERDAKMALYKAEPSTIDRTLEVTNAITSLVE